MKFYNNNNELDSQFNHDRPTEVSKAEPCIHCGKPDWCYRIGALTVCKRGAEPAMGWEKTSKSDKESTLYYAPTQPKKPIRPANKQEFFYPDRKGVPLVKVLRIDDGKGKKDFPQFHWKAAIRQWVSGLTDEVKKQVPIYRYQQVKEAIAAGRPIFIVEGEGVADRLWEIGLCATTTLGGSGKFHSYGDYQQDLTGAKLVLCPDRDEPGLKYMEAIAKVFPHARWVYAPPNEFFWQHLPESNGVDIADWIDSGATAKDIYNAIRDKWAELAKTLAKTDSSSAAPSQEKTVSQLETEILEAAASRNPSLALTKVAAINNLPFHRVEAWANALLKEQGLESKYDLDRAEYERCVLEIREIELKETDPGLKSWRLRKLAGRNHCSVEQMLDSYYKSMLVQHLEDPISLKEFRLTQPQGRKWLLRGWIPEASLVLFHGHGGIGKTLYIHHLMKHVVQGIDWGEYKVKTGHNGILYIQSDTGLASAVEALKQAGVPDDVQIHIHNKWRIEHMAYLYNWIQKYRPALVVIDSLTSVNRYSTVNENSTEYAQPILQMRDIAAEFGCSFIIIHHSNSAGEARGTKAVRAAVDEVWRIERSNEKDESDPKRLLVIEKSRSRITQRYEMQFDDDDFSWGLLEPEDENGNATQNSGARWLIVNHLNKHLGVRYSAEDLAQELNSASASTIRRELAGLFREGLIDREPNPNYDSSTKGESKHLYLVRL